MANPTGKQLLDLITEYQVAVSVQGVIGIHKTTRDPDVIAEEYERVLRQFSSGPLE